MLVRAGGVLRTTEDDVNGVMASEDRGGVSVLKVSRDAAVALSEGVVWMRNSQLPRVELCSFLRWRGRRVGEEGAVAALDLGRHDHDGRCCSVRRPRRIRPQIRCLYLQVSQASLAY